MTIEEYKEAESDLLAVIDALKPVLAKETIDNTLFYLGHAELEMSYELLCLDLIEQKEQLTHPMQKSLLDLGLVLKLDKASIYDEHFWQHFLSWLKITSD